MLLCRILKFTRSLGEGTIVTCVLELYINMRSGRRGREGMVIGFTYPISGPTIIRCVQSAALSNHHWQDIGKSCVHTDPKLRHRCQFQQVGRAPVHFCPTDFFLLSMYY